MKKTLNHILALVSIIIYTSALQAQNTMNAIYELRGVREMGAGFEFTKDGKFSFYLAYGGLDRNATGTYQLAGDTIKLKSDKVPASDFEVASRKKDSNIPGFAIKVDDKNTFIVSYVIAVALINGQMHSFNCNSDGIINIDTNACEKIFLWNQLYGDLMTEIYDKEKNDAVKNYITVKMKPTLEQFTFSGIDLILKDGELILPSNPLLNDSDLKFLKVK